MRTTILILFFWFLVGCAYTVRRDYNESGQQIGKTLHWRFIIQEEATLTVHDKYNLKFKSKPDSETVQMLRAAFEAGKAAAK